MAYHDGLHRSVQTFDKDEVVTQFISSVNEFSISYEPHSGIVEVVSDYKDNRDKLAKAFVNAFLKTDEDVDEVPLKKFDLTRLNVPYDFMKDVDATDLIDDVIEERAENDPVFRQALSEEKDRKQNGEDMSFFVKNVV